MADIYVSRCILKEDFMPCRDEQIKENAKIVENCMFSTEELNKIEEIRN